MSHMFARSSRSDSNRERERHKRRCHDNLVGRNYDLAIEEVKRRKANGFGRFENRLPLKFYEDNYRKRNEIVTIVISSSDEEDGEIREDGGDLLRNKLNNDKLQIAYSYDENPKETQKEKNILDKNHKNNDNLPVVYSYDVHPKELQKEKRFLDRNNKNNDNLPITYSNNVNPKETQKEKKNLDRSNKNNDNLPIAYSNDVNPKQTQKEKQNLDRNNKNKINDDISILDKEKEKRKETHRRKTDKYHDRIYSRISQLGKDKRYRRRCEYEKSDPNKKKKKQDEEKRNENRNDVEEGEIRDDKENSDRNKKRTSQISSSSKEKLTQKHKETEYSDKNGNRRKSKISRSTKDNGKEKRNENSISKEKKKNKSSISVSKIEKPVEKRREENESFMTMNESSESSGEIDDSDEINNMSLDSWQKLVGHLNSDQSNVYFKCGRLTALRKIAEDLKENNINQINRCLIYLGMEKCHRFLTVTKAIESSGGIQTKDGLCRRSAGSVFFTLIKSDKNISRLMKRKIFFDKESYNESRKYLWWNAIKRSQYKRRFRHHSKRHWRSEFRSCTFIDLDYFKCFKDFRNHYIPVISSFPTLESDSDNRSTEAGPTNKTDAIPTAPEVILIDDDIDSEDDFELEIDDSYVS